MTQALPERPPLRSRRPWSSRTSTASDIVAAVALFIGEAVALAWIIFSYGMERWAAEGDLAEIDATRLPEIASTKLLLYVVLALAGLAALSRAPWTLVSHLFVALFLGALLTGAQEEYGRTRPDPTPTPTVQYTPCLSGSGKCH
jgi:putative exporter of polyketide antibiotics